MTVIPCRFAPVFALSFIIAVPAAAFDEYRLDDGTAESNIGVGEPPFGMACLNHFTASGETLEIGSISIAWGIVPNNTPATLLVYRDPNGDGNPMDADWILGQAIMTSVSDNAFTTYHFDPISFTRDESFFVGFWLQQPAGGWGPAAFDRTEPQGESWLVISFQNFFINDLGSNLMPPTRVENVNGLGAGNWMIRANAVPGPSAIGIVTLAALVNRRRRTARIT